RAARRERHGGAQTVCMRKALEDLRAGGAEVTVPGRVLRERGRRKRCRLVGKPGRTVDEFRALVRAGPGAHRLAVEECANRRDWTYGVEGTLVVPRATAGIGYGVRERKEELHVPPEPMLQIAVVIAARDVLREQIPVSGWKLRTRTVRPVLGDHLLLVSQTGADIEQGLRLRTVFGRAVPSRARGGAQRSRSDGEGRDVLPLGADEPLGNQGPGPVQVAQRLPGAWVVNGRRGERQPDLHRLVRRNVVGVIGVGNAGDAAGFVAELIRTVVVMQVEHRPGGDVA